jgi:hypothetical protein
VDLVMRSSLGDEEAVRVARDALADIFNDEAGSVQFRLFEALLGFASKEFGYWPEAACWPAAFKLAMVWAHACKLHNLYHAAGADPEKLADIFVAENRHLSADILARDPAYWNDVLHHHRLNRAFFLTHVVARTLAGNSPEVLSAVGAAEMVRARAMRDVGEVPIPVPEFFCDTALARNSTGSLFGGDRAAALGPFIGEDASQVLSSPQMEELVAEAISGLESDPHQHGWATVEAVARDLPLYGRLQDRLQDLLGKVDFVEMLEVDPASARYALRVAANQMWNVDDVGLRARYEAALLRFAASRASSFTRSASNDEESQGGASNVVIAELIELALRLSVRPSDPRTTARSFARLLEQLVKAWPLLGDNVGYAATKLVLELPAEQLHGMWPLMLYLRASRQKAL